MADTRVVRVIQYLCFIKLANKYAICMPRSYALPSGMEDGKHVDIYIYPDARENNWLNPIPLRAKIWRHMGRICFAFSGCCEPLLEHIIRLKDRCMRVAVPVQVGVEKPEGVQGVEKVVKAFSKEGGDND